MARAGAASRIEQWAAVLQQHARAKFFGDRAARTLRLACDRGYSAEQGAGSKTYLGHIKNSGLRILIDAIAKRYFLFHG
ncbi:MAG: hypothetical protein ACYDC3_08555 [Candidatus Binataceae bacterium]